MTLEIHELENFMENLRPQIKNTLSPPSEADWQSWHDYLHAETSRIQKKFQSNFHLLKPKVAERYIQLNFLDLLRLIDSIEDESQNTVGKDHSSTNEFCQMLLTYLERVLVHLLKYYSAYIDQDLPLPQFFLQKEKASISGNLLELKRLYQRTEIDAHLLDIAFRPINEFLKRNHNQYTYRELQYFQTFIKEWLPLLDMKLEEDMNWQVHYKLYYLNFNNVEYRIYCTGRLHDKLEELPSLPEKIEKVNWYVSTLRRLHQMPHVALLPGQPSIINQALAVIEEEYQYLIDSENLKELATTQVDRSSQTILKVPLSSLQLAQLASTLESVGFFPDAKPGEIIRFFANNFSSVSDKTILESSFHTQYYSRATNVRTAKTGIVEWVDKVKKALEDETVRTN